MRSIGARGVAVLAVDGAVFGDAAEGGSVVRVVGSVRDDEVADAVVSAGVSGELHAAASTNTKSRKGERNVPGMRRKGVIDQYFGQERVSDHDARIADGLQNGERFQSGPISWKPLQSPTRYREP